MWAQQQWALGTGTGSGLFVGGRVGSGKWKPKRDDETESGSVKGGVCSAKAGCRENCGERARRGEKKGRQKRCSRHVETERRMVSSWDR